MECHYIYGETFKKLYEKLIKLINMLGEIINVTRCCHREDLKYI